MMIEWAMWFALGFLTAAVLALVLMASLWRRAVRLTTRRVVDSVPADVEAALAEKDMQAARFARDIRRHELALADLRRRNTEERVAVGHQTIALDAMRQARDAESAKVAAGLGRENALAEEIAARERELARRAEAIAAAQAAIVGHEQTIADHEATIAGLQNDIDGRDVELAARKTEIAAREVQIDGLRQEITDKKARIEELRITLGLAETVLSQEKDRADRLDKRIERLVGDVAEREEVADRRQRELERSRQALTSANARIATLTTRLEGAEGAAKAGDNVNHSVDLLEQQMRDLEHRLEAAEAERDRLANSVGERRRDSGESGSAPSRAQLRDQIADLAAEMVRLTGAVESDPVIARLVAGPEAGAGPRPSLADRIRAVQAAAANGGARSQGG